MTHVRNQAIAARIEHLGRLNDRRLKANEAGDLNELEAVAREYLLLKQPCNTIAREIMIAVSVRRNLLPTHSVG